MGAETPVPEEGELMDPYLNRHEINSGICDEEFAANPDDLDVDGYGNDPFTNDAGGD